MYFGTKLKVSVDLTVIEVISILGYTLRHCHKRPVE